MKIFASVQVPDGLRKKMEAAQKRREAKVWLALQEGAVDIHRTAVLSIAQVTPGSTSAIRYSRAGRKRTVQVSPPGGAPNTDTGRLLQSIRIAPLKSKMEVQVGTDVKYGAWLEFGTQIMRPRPWLGPAYDKHKEEIIEAVKAALGF